VDEPLPHELPLLGEHLHAIAAALADVHHPVAREVDAVERLRKLHLVGRRARDVVVRRRVVVDLAQRNPVASPSALERARVHVVDDNPLVQEAVGDEDLARILVELERADPGGKTAVCWLSCLTWSAGIFVLDDRSP